MQQAPLIFFGRIFDNLAIDGKFALRNLRGFRNNIPFKIDEMAKMAEQGFKDVKFSDEPDRQMITNYEEGLYNL